MMLRLRLVPSVMLAGLLSSVIACGASTSDDGTPAPTPTAPTPTTPAPTPTTEPPPPPAKKLPFENIAWSTCTIPLGQGKSVSADCATVDAPARRGGADIGTVPVAVYRLKSERQPAKAQLWMLNGGPGGSGFQLAPYAEIVRSTFQADIDVYLVDHRGTGESAFLECPAANTARTQAEYGKLCSDEIHKKYGARIDGFSTTEAAHDVRELIDSTVAEGQKVFVYGGSYGSYWAHRLVQLPNLHLDAMVTDGNCISKTCSFDTPQSMQVDEGAKAIFDTCKEQSDCNAHLGPDPWTTVKGTLAKLATGHCSQAKLAALAPADIAMTIGIYWPIGVPATMYRLERCSAADVVALDKLYDGLVQALGRSPVSGATGALVDVPQSTSEATASTVTRRKVRVFPHRRGPVPAPNENESFSTTLQLHVIASELISRPAPTQQQLAAKIPALTFKPDPASLDNAIFDAWTPYPRDGFMDNWMSRDVPWLMLQGTFDFQTAFPLSQTALANVKDPSLQFVKVDGAGHGVAFTSACSRKMVESFFADPKAKVDASCVPEVKQHALDTRPEYVQYFFGTKSLWD